jgi:hypothetical protein
MNGPGWLICLFLFYQTDQTLGAETAAAFFFCFLSLSCTMGNVRVCERANGDTGIKDLRFGTRVHNGCRLGLLNSFQRYPPKVHRTIKEYICFSRHQITKAFCHVSQRFVLLDTHCNSVSFILRTCKNTVEIVMHLSR